MKIVVLGSSGQLGICLKEEISKTSHEQFCFSKEDLDITNYEKIAKLISDISPDVVINAAAYTKVDEAEDFPEHSNNINNIAVEKISYICKLVNSLLIHISTDYVFDGKSEAPYSENSLTNPKSVYGKTKLFGENKIIDSGCNYFIIRTSWVYSEYASNFLKTILKLSEHNKSINVIDDQFGNPTYARDLAIAIIEMLKSINKKNIYYGIYNFCGNETCSWYTFAQKIKYLANKNRFNLGVKINSITTKDFSSKAPRPANSKLNCSKIYKKFNISPSNLEVGIIRTLNSLN